MKEEDVELLSWENDTAVGRQGDSYIIYQVFDNGELWISGPKWKQKKDKHGQPINHPNRIVKLKSREQAVVIAEGINKLFNSALFQASM